MKRFFKTLLFLYLALFFFRLGVIGLIFPILPQVPFFVLSFMFLAGASSHFKRFIVSTKLYNKFLKNYVLKHPKIAAFFYDEIPQPEYSGKKKEHAPEAEEVIPPPKGTSETIKEKLSEAETVITTPVNIADEKKENSPENEKNDLGVNEK